MLTVSIVVFVDQFTKALVRSEMPLGTFSRPFGGDFIWLWHVTNPGMAFGVEWLPPIALIFIKTVAFIAIGYYLFTRPRLPALQSFPLALIMGGAMGNLIDRLLIGEVVDFISVDLPDFLMHRFPTFNVADSAVSIGVTLLLLANLLTPHRPAAKADAADEPTEHTPATITPAAETENE